MSSNKEWCDRCETRDFAAGRHKLNHVGYNGEMFSKMVSRMIVCNDCYKEMKNSDKWSL